MVGLQLARSSTDLLGLLAMACVLLALFFWQWHVKQKIARAWRAAARDLGLRYRTCEKLPEITGHLDDVRVTARIQRLHEHKADNYVTSAQAMLPTALPVSSRIVPRSMLASLGRLLEGSTEVTSGDPSFDEAFLMTSGDPQALQRRIGAPQRTALLAALERAGQLELKARWIHWQEGGLHSDPNRALVMLQLLVELCHELEPAA